MKKLVAMILLIVCMAGVATAETIDLSSLSFEDLMALRNQLNEEIISRPEWRSVNVPEGTWIIGEDIPEGTYSISAPAYTSIEIYDEKGKKISTHHIFFDLPVGKAILKAGWTLEAKGPISIAPPISLEF